MDRSAIQRLGMLDMDRGAIHDYRCTSIFTSIINQIESLSWIAPRSNVLDMPAMDRGAIHDYRHSAIHVDRVQRLLD